MLRYQCFLAVCRKDLAAGHFSLTLSDDKLFLWSNEDYVIPENEEMFGFGSGEYVTEALASDVMGDQDGRWWQFNLEGSAKNLLVILDQGRKLAGHLKGLDIFNKAPSTEWLLLPGNGQV